MANSGVLKPFFSFLRKYFVFEGLMLVCILIGTLCSLAAPYFLAKIIDQVIPASNRALLLNLFLIIVGINVLRFVIGMCSEYLNTWLSGRIITDIKRALFFNLLNMPFPYFERNKPGEVIQVISQEADKIQFFLTTGVIRLLNNAFTLLSLAVMLCYLNYRLFLITILMLPVIAFLNARISRHVRRLVKNTGIKEGELYNFYFERIKNISLVKLFNTFEYEQGQFFAKTNNLIRLNLQNARMTAFGNNGSNFFISLSPLLILLIGGYHVINHTMTIGSLVAFIQYSNRLIVPTNDFLNLYIDYVKAHESAKRILPFLRPGRSEERSQYPEIEFETVRKVTCSNVGFAVNETEILAEINMEFIRGHSYGIVGANGAGKSTLVKLISKLYEPTAGNILVNNNIPLANISRSKWCRHITVISQHACILHESIRENLMYASRNATEGELWNSLEAVNLRSYVQSLPKGLDTLIGDGNECANPSGGQIQKLSLARSFLRRADIIILDEVTSAMDDHSRKEIMDIILKTLSDKIIIAITHDITDAMLFDQVFLLENGALAEFGSHADLVRVNGKYKSLFSL